MLIVTVGRAPRRSRRFGSRPCPPPRAIRCRGRDAASASATLNSSSPICSGNAVRETLLQRSRERLKRVRRPSSQDRQLPKEVSRWYRSFASTGDPTVRASSTRAAASSSNRAAISACASYTSAPARKAGSCSSRASAVASAWSLTASAVLPAEHVADSSQDQRVGAHLGVGRGAVGLVGEPAGFIVPAAPGEVVRVCAQREPAHLGVGGWGGDQPLGDRTALAQASTLEQHQRVGRGDRLLERVMVRTRPAQRSGRLSARRKARRARSFDPRTLSG